MTIQDTRHEASLITVLDPRDGSLVGRLEPSTPDEVTVAVRASRAAQPGWEDVTPEQRGRMLGTAANLLRDHLEELAELNLRETGKPINDARGGVEAGANTLSQYAELGPLQRGHSLRGGRLAADYTVVEPRGVAVVLTPWNDPVAVAAGLLGAALVTGNTVIHKPSERCPHLGLRLGEILAEAFPPDVLITLTGDGETGELLTREPEVDVIAHVGSSATGEQIARTAVSTGAHVIRENGGNDPLVIDDDVDPRWAAAQAALGSFANAGQICTSVERVYVHRQIADEFGEALVAEARERNEKHVIGPLVDARLRDAVHAQVADAIARGASLRCGGEVPDGPGSWYPATVLWDCTPDMTIMTEETFGPVAPVQVVDDFDEGLRLAAAGRYGLAATVLTNRVDHAHRAVAALRVGTVKVNGVFGGAPGGAAQPRRASGAGFGYGPELLDEFTQVKVVHIGVGEPREGRS